MNPTNYKQPNFIFMALNSLIQGIICIFPALLLCSSTKWYSSTILLFLLYLWLAKFFTSLLREALIKNSAINPALIAIKLALATLLIFLLFFRTSLNFTIILVLYELYQLFASINLKNMLINSQYVLVKACFNGIIFNVMIFSLDQNKFDYSMFTLFIFAFFIALNMITTRQLYDYNGQWKKTSMVLLKLISFLGTVAYLYWQNNHQLLTDWLFYVLSISLVVILFFLKLINNHKKRELLLHLFSLLLLFAYYYLNK